MAYGQKSLWIHGGHGGHGIFWELLRKKSLEEIFFKMLLTQEILWIRSLSPNKIFNENH